MGNQRELLQVSPRRGRGAILRLRPRATSAVEQILAASNPFYAHLRRRGDALQFSNLDGPDTDEGIASEDHLIIQSGGKMWCDYQYFVDRVRILAPSLDDALFYVGDEEDYIDEFRIERGTLGYVRVHAGCWQDLEQYLRERGLW